MDVASLAATYAGMNAGATRDALSAVFLKQQAESVQAVADMLTQAAETAKAMTPDGVGTLLDKSA